MSRKLTTKEFIKKSIQIHGNLYDYKKVKYKTSKNKVLVICHKHGEFFQIAGEHLAGCGCPKCASKNMDTKLFIEKAIEQHCNKYDYSIVEYKNSKEKVNIICSIHGIFKQTPTKHLYGDGCPECANNIKLTKNEFVAKANIVHNNKYDYTKVDYNGNKHDIKIICSVHGEFAQKATKHLSGNGCPLCAKENKGWTFSQWEKAGLNSTKFEGFKFYIIKCWNNFESFYKIGKTFNSLSRRYKTKIKMPYRWKLIKIEEGDARTISEIEIEFKHNNKKYRYNPEIKFKGMTECYSELI